MVEKENRANFESVKLSILEKVSKVGPMGNIESWKKAFSEIEFVNSAYSEVIDEALYERGSGVHEMMDINWAERSITERTFYVSFMKNPEDMEIRYDMVIENELKLTQVVSNPQTIWYMWLDGCFSGEDLTEEALSDFVGLVTDEHKEKRDYIDVLDLEQIRIERLEAKVAPI
jgi:hypothetical protein